MAEPSHRYELRFVLDDKRFYWRNDNCGVTLTDAGRQSSISWQAAGGAALERRLWTDIAQVGMTAASDGRNAVNQCRIGFRDGRSILVTDTGAHGTLDESQTPIYRDFVRALHARLAAAPEGTIRFAAGVTEGRHKAMQVILAICALLFVGLPLVLLLIVRDWRILGLVAAGCAFVWPFWKIAENNRPRSYDPKYPPGELME